MPSRQLSLDGVTVRTPLLVPSVSSKGFAVDAEGMSENDSLLAAVLPAVPTAILISAYDLHTGALPAVSAAIQETGPEAPLPPDVLLFTDSGGYELQESFEPTFPPASNWRRHEYTAADQLTVVMAMPQRRGRVVVSFDPPGRQQLNYREQAAQQREHLAPASAAKDLLLKPWRGAFHDFTDFADLGSLDGFALLGVTEVELGATLIDRLVNLARLRAALDRTAPDLPIHLFGSLDPALSPVYFHFGAEVFDGLSWLRYSYRGGLSVHAAQAALLDAQFDASLQHLEVRRLLANLGYLSALSEQMGAMEADPVTAFDGFAASDAMIFLAQQVHARLDGTA